MLDKERGVQARGIPQVVETPEKFLDIAKFIREEILGKPAPEHYDNYETYLEAEDACILGQCRAVIEIG